jgi:hypothetical protein
MTDAEREVYLSEYNAANEFYRHHDIMGWTILNIFMTSSYVLLGSYVYLERELLPLAVASIGADLVGIGMFLRMSDYNNPRRTRIFQLEELLGMDHHRFVNRELHRTDIGLVEQFRHRYITVHKLKWMQLFGLILAWVLLTLRSL